MTKLSVNINKIATLRNARGGASPNVQKFAEDCQRFGADGITVHPRPDERHITLLDCYAISEVITTEFNIEGYPDKRYVDLVKSIKPIQATLVPDKPDVLTSNAGWDVEKNQHLLRDVINQFHADGLRVSLFIGTDKTQIEWAQKVGADRIELYTGPYADAFPQQAMAIQAFIEAHHLALELGLGINAGHDLNLDNLTFFKKNLPNLLEVSIGHALIGDALYLGIENTIQLYKRCLQ